MNFKINNSSPQSNILSLKCKFRFEQFHRVFMDSQKKKNDREGIHGPQNPPVREKDPTIKYYEVSYK